MTDLQARLDALPILRQGYACHSRRTETPAEYYEAEYRTALARLALAREWIENNGHGWRCDTRIDSARECTCGRDALLQKLEVPRG
jgi:hypothetical protein